MPILRCPYCGEQIQQGAEYCGHCGKQIDKPVIDEYATYHDDLGGFMRKWIGIFILLFVYFCMMAAWFNQMGLLFVVVMTVLLTAVTYIVLKKIF